MMIKLEQLFWGHDGERYRLLGASSQTHADVAARLRDRLGTPVSEIKPFLVSAPEGDLLIMMCGQEGTPDKIGRKTLFFHILIGDREECTRYHVNAYSLWQNGHFLSQSEYDAVKDSVEMLSVPPLSEIHAPAAELPLQEGRQWIIRSNEPCNDWARLLGSRIDDVKWASFTWNPLDDFALFVMPKSTATTQPGFTERSASPSCDGKKEKKSSRTSIFLGILLILSLGFNGWLGWRRIEKRHPQPTPTTVETKKIVEKTVTAETKKAKFNWREKFNQTDKEKSELWRIWTSKAKDGYKKDYEILTSMIEELEK